MDKNAATASCSRRLVGVLSALVCVVTMIFVSGPIFSSS